MNKFFATALFSAYVFVGSTGSSALAATAKNKSSGANQNSDRPIVVPEQLRKELKAVQVVAHDLKNPRGMYIRPDGAVLVAEAGVGDPKTPDSSDLLLLTDRDDDGKFDSRDERKVLLDKQLSVNIFSHVRRDEVFGLAAIAAADGTILMTHGVFDGPSQLFEIAGDKVTPLGQAEGNLNSLAYDPKRGIWVAASSSRNQVVRVSRSAKVDVILKIPNLSNGQEAVPAYVRYDKRTGEIMVSLFTGSIEGETGGDGTELKARSGKIIRVNPDNGRMTDVVTGLTTPADFVLDANGNIYVLEFCDAFMDPVKTRSDMWNRANHGGFRRFSGRLLRIDRKTGDAVVIADQLDAPTNLALHVNTLLIAQGMGTPGRPIPGLKGETKLEGFISAMDISKH